MSISYLRKILYIVMEKVRKHEGHKNFEQMTESFMKECFIGSIEC